MSEPTPKPPIKSGWRGNLNGAVEHTDNSSIQVSQVTLNLDQTTAWALCNLLTDSAIERSCALEGKQIEALSTLGAALGRLIDHPSANNGGRECVK